MAFELTFDGAASPNTQNISIPNIVETGDFTLTANLTIEDATAGTRLYGQASGFASYMTFANGTLNIRRDDSVSITMDYTGLVTQGVSFEFSISRVSGIWSATIDGDPLGAPSGTLSGTITIDSLGAIFTSGGVGTSAPMRIRDFDWQGTVTRTYLVNEGTGITVSDSSGGGNDGTLINPTAADGQWVSLASGPTITGPDTTTEGATTAQTGTLLDTVTVQSLISGSYSIAQTIDSQTATELEYVAESGVNLCTTGNPVSGVPLEPTVTAAGITPYVIQQKVDDGVNPPATRNITLNPEATHDVIQTMIAAANTTTGESIFGTGLIAVENNMQAYVPKAVNGMNITWADDGTFTTDADQTENITVGYFSPSTEQWSCLTLTIQNSSIVSIGHFGFAFPNFQFPLLDNTN